MRRNRPELFKGRHFEAEIIVLCVRWYLRYPLSLRQLQEIMAERNLSVDHVTIWRWVQRYSPELNRLCHPESIGDGIVCIGDRADASVCAVDEKMLARKNCGHID